MVVPKKQKVTELLKNEILDKEKKNEYSSDKFKKIEDKVKDSLKKQKTDQALIDITV